MYRFEKLSVWHESLKLARLCYALARLLPDYEQFGLRDQIRRAATSVLLNIAEGAGSNSDKEFLRFLYVARRSLYEVVALLKFIEVEYPKVRIDTAITQSDLVGKMPNGLIRKLRSKG